MYVVTWGRCEIHVCSVLVNSWCETEHFLHDVPTLWMFCGMESFAPPPSFFQPFLFCSISVSFGVCRPKEAIKPQISLQWLTYSQSVSLPSVCSHLISAHTLCLSLPSPRWWDAICIGHTRTQSPCILCSASSHGFLTQHICLYGRGERSTTPTRLSHSPAAAIYRINV